MNTSQKFLLVVTGLFVSGLAIEARSENVIVTPATPVYVEDDPLIAIEPGVSVGVGGVYGGWGYGPHGYYGGYHGYHDHPGYDGHHGGYHHDYGHGYHGRGGGGGHRR